jgi:uncharacterized membrane protein YhdT
MPKFHFSQSIKSKTVIAAFSLLAVLNAHADAVLGHPLWFTFVSSFIMFPLCAAVCALLFEDISELTTPEQRSAILFRR